MSHSTRVRGLKSSIRSWLMSGIWSHSTRVRGLKWLIIHPDIKSRQVALYTSAWIEISAHQAPGTTPLVALYTSAWIEINPPKNYWFPKLSRTLHECVDWNCDKTTHAFKYTVALYTSAWIEIGNPFKSAWNLCVALYTSAWIEIYPLSRHKHLWCVALYTSAWIEIALTDCVRGKCRCRTLHECVDWNFTPLMRQVVTSRRTLHECVDWNDTIYRQITVFPIVALYTSAWIEIIRNWERTGASSGRTLHECVDWNFI